MYLLGASFAAAITTIMQKTHRSMGVDLTTLAWHDVRRPRFLPPRFLPTCRHIARFRGFGSAACYGTDRTRRYFRGLGVDADGADCKRILPYLSRRVGRRLVPRRTFCCSMYRLCSATAINLAVLLARRTLQHCGRPLTGYESGRWASTNTVGVDQHPNLGSERNLEASRRQSSEALIDGSSLEQRSTTARLILVPTGPGPFCNKVQAPG